MKARSGFMSGGWRSRRISRPSWRSICRAPRWWWATARPRVRCRKRKYPEVKFLGALSGEALTRAYAGSDVFVFPSRTDTFGLVTLEALACGLTVAAYPVEGPRDVVGPDVPGGPEVAVLDEDLRTACLGALELALTRGAHPPGFCREPLLAGLHAPVPGQYRGRARPGPPRPQQGLIRRRTALSEPHRWAEGARKPRYPAPPMTAPNARLTAREYAFFGLALLFWAGFVILLGKDTSWDFRNYHWYAPYALFQSSHGDRRGGGASGQLLQPLSRHALLLACHPHPFLGRVGHAGRGAGRQPDPALSDRTLRAWSGKPLGPQDHAQGRWRCWGWWARSP